jgi:hypothetical protein
VAYVTSSVHEEVAIEQANHNKISRVTCQNIINVCGRVGLISCRVVSFTWHTCIVGLADDSAKK